MLDVRFIIGQICCAVPCAVRSESSYSMAEKQTRSQRPGLRVDQVTKSVLCDTEPFFWPNIE